jgi:hypothetical protein
MFNFQLVHHAKAAKGMAPQSRNRFHNMCVALISVCQRRLAVGAKPAGFTH